MLLRTKKKVHNFVKVHGNGHSRCVAQSISDSWEKECYSNVRIFAKDCKQPNGKSKFLSANKFVLAAASKKFAMMLVDTDDDVTIIVPDHDFATLKLLLQYIYSGKVFVDCFTQELHTLLTEWNICSPEVIPITSEKNSNNSQDVIKSQIMPEKFGYKANFPVNKKTLANKNTTIVSHGSIGNYQYVGSDNLLPKQNINNKCRTNSAEQTMNSGGVEIPLIDISSNLSTTGNSNPKPVVIASPIRNRKFKTKSTSSAASLSSSGYVFLATYINNSKNKLKKRAVTFKTSEKKTSPSITQVGLLAVDGSLKSTISTSEESGIICEVNSNIVNGEKNTKKPMECNMGCENAQNLSDHQNNEVVEVETEQDLHDLTLALKLLKNEKTNHQQLNTLTLELSNKVQRHKSYAKHFLGLNSVDSSGQIASRMPCLTCGKIVFRDYMSTHVKIHTTERPYLCDQCGQTFSLPERLRNHLKNMHPDESQMKLHICPECGKVFKKSEYLKRHLTFHNGLKPYNCPYCDKSFRLPNVLLKHKRTHTGEKPYECETCHKRFSARTNYVVHVRTHRNKSRILETAENFLDPETQLLKCDVCDTTFHREYAFLVHKAAHKGEEPKLPCRHCSENLASYKLLREHTRDQHADALYHCDHCPSMFVYKTALHSHLQVHMTGKQFSCDLCGKEFKKKVQLDMHHRGIHSNIRPFSCRFCDKTFKSKLTQRQHERIHTGERPYQCPQCPKAFRQDVHLANHLRLHTGEKPFICTYCSKAFAHKNNLSIHVKIHTGAKNVCNVCGQVFRTLVKLRLHESTHSPINISSAEQITDGTS